MFGQSHAKFSAGFTNVSSLTVAAYDLVPCPGGLLPYKRLMGEAQLDGVAFSRLDLLKGVVFSIELLQWGRTFSDFCGNKVRHIYG